MKIALGTAQFGLPYGIANTHGQVPASETAAILALAASNGVDTLDTAIAYGDSERRLGQVGVHGWRIVSKLSAVPPGCVDVPAWVEAEVRASLERLGVERLYGLLLHRPAALLEPGGPELWRGLQRVKALSLAERIGLSIYDPSALDDVTAAFAYDLVQAPLNVLDGRLIESGWLARLAAAGVEVHARSAFLQGLLLMERSARPARFQRWAPVLDAYDAWVADTGVAPQQACLGYLLSLPEISRVIVGVDSAVQLAGLLAVTPGPLPPPALRCHDLALLEPGRWPAA